ncbi:RDD family protein [Geomicrobium sp. JCM 19039]|uniref:RDD family protein n=1 Tax=Geomicrobium sp. JCM 19039 TaxID=1460636 RepID=UPI00045F4153|nr:RDD family protein [Geomicrobium sp. JCM 19039]GAK14409.1 hypothetical protein JCM19039_4325 [Geomicrobium sp. JCM 19039]
MQMYAGFWLRFWAYVMDLLIVASLNVIFIRPVFALWLPDEPAIGVFAIEAIMVTISYYVYFILLTKWRQQTIGKMAFGLRVESLEGGSLLWKDVFVREVAGRILHRVFVITNLFYIMIAVHPEKAGVHDLLSDTRVVVKRGSIGVRENDMHSH